MLSVKFQRALNPYVQGDLRRPAQLSMNFCKISGVIHLIFLFNGNFMPILLSSAFLFIISLTVLSDIFPPIAILIK